MDLLNIKMIILGDLYINFTNSNVPRNNNIKQTAVMTKYGFKQHVLQPTTNTCLQKMTILRQTV